MNWAELARAANISYEALRAIRRGDYRPGDITARDLDDALKWRRGSVYAILGGGEPTPLTATAPVTAEPGDVDLEELMQDPEARAALRTIIRRIRGEPTEPDSPGRDEEAG